MTNELENVIERYENEAIDRRDLERAMRLNWLINAYKSGQFDDDTVVMHVQTIHYKEPHEWPRSEYSDRKAA